MKNNIISYLLLILFLILPATYSWSAGKLEEKYYVLLDARNNFFSKNLELAFFQYARSNDVELVMYSVDSFNPTEKLNLNKRGADYLYPVIIMSGYDPDRLQEVEDFYFRKGESSLEGNMGSALFINEPIGQKQDFAFRLPWHSIAFDTTQMAKEILVSQNQTVIDGQIEAINAMSIEELTRQTRQDNPNAERSLIVIITGYSDKEHNLYNTIYYKLLALNTDPTLNIVPLYAADALDPNYDPAEAERKRKEIEIEKKRKEQEDLAKGIEPPSRESLIRAFGVKDTLTYQFFNKYITTHTIPQNTSVIVAPNDETGLIVHQFFIDNNITETPPQIVGFGNAPEGQRNTTKTSPIILTFDIDYQKYVELIMDRSKELYKRVQDYPLTSAMMEGKEPYKTFTGEEDVFPLKPVHRASP